MMLQVILNEAGDEEVAVVVARLQAQLERVTGRFARGLQQFRLQLPREDFIAIALIY